jgi:hypothetical protein
MIACIESEKNIRCECKIIDIVNDTIMYLLFNKKVKDKCNRIILKDLLYLDEQLMVEKIRRSTAW